MSGTENKTESKQDTTPWAPQAAALQDAFGKAQTAYGQASQAQAPTDFLAQYTPDQLATFKSMVNYGNNSAIPGQTADASGKMLASGTNASQGALAGLGNYDPTKLNNTGSIVDSANRYASGFDYDAQVRNAMLPAMQTARDVTLPGIAQSASNSGNASSSRRGIAEGMVQRGLAQQATDLGSALRNDAYKTGLGLASSNAVANNQQGLGALTAQGQLGNNAAGLGTEAGNASIAGQTSLYGLAGAGGAGQQASQQQMLDNIIAQYQSGVSSPYDALNGLMPIIGGQNWGSHMTGEKTETKTPGTLDWITGLTGAAGSLMGGYGSFKGK